MVDYILQSTCLVNSAGLYNGKAGLSLALFEASKYLQDESVEEKAFNLLQEALVVKHSDLNFENGLSGIGHVLLYLIENEYIEADFDEIFGTQHELIVKSFEAIEKEPLRLVNSLQVIYYFSKLSNIKKDDGRLPKIIQKIFEGLELFLTVQFFDFKDILYVNDKMDVLNIYEIYLKLVNDADYRYFSHALLEDYADLYREGRVISSITTGYFIGMLAKKNKIEGYHDIVVDQITNGVKNIHVDLLSLKEKIEVIQLITVVENNGIVQHEFLSGIKIDFQNETIQSLLKTVDRKSSPLGYKEGLSRLLLFCTTKHSEPLLF